LSNEDQKLDKTASRIEGNGKWSLRRPKLSTRKFSAWRKRRRKKKKKKKKKKKNKEEEEEEEEEEKKKKKKKKKEEEEEVRSVDFIQYTTEAYLNLCFKLPRAQ
jgi:DNA-directed RNA polymerase delta subunit